MGAEMGGWASGNKEVTSGRFPCIPVLMPLPDGEGMRLIANCYGDDKEELAKLVAAAPELLEACRDVVKTHPRFIEGKGVKYGSVIQVDLPGKVWDAMLAAIAKASNGVRSVPERSEGLAEGRVGE